MARQRSVGKGESGIVDGEGEVLARKLGVGCGVETSTWPLALLPLLIAYTLLFIKAQ
jgi:hypothetical protein